MFYYITSVQLEIQHNTVEIYDNLKMKDYNFKGVNGKEAYIEDGALWTTGFLTI